MGATIQAISFQRSDGRQTYSVGQGVGVKADGVNGEIAFIVQEGKGEFSAVLKLTERGELSRRIISVRYGFDQIGPWLTEDEIAEAKRRKAAERIAGAADLASVLFSDVEQLRKEVMQGIGVLDECLSQPRGIGDMAVKIGIGIQTIEEAIKRFDPPGVAEAVSDYAQRLQALLSGSERDPQDG